ncbi:MAG: alpha/beta hydrolase [Culicoidibacterales bacterium]
MSTFSEKQVIVQGKYPLAATLTIPDAPTTKLAAVVIVGGTGGGDRDGNMKRKKMKPNIYRDLAQFFARQGCLVIRYDKRGVGGSGGIQVETGFDELVDDIISNIKYLEALPEVERVILCGHSEGSMLVAVANERHHVDGIIQLAGAGMCIRKALEYQNYLLLQEIQSLKGIKGWLLRKQINETNYLDKVNDLFAKCQASEKAVIRIQLMKTPAKWFREHDRYTDERLTELMISAQCPVLALTGSHDVQADPAYIAKITALEQPHITASVIAQMDHLLKPYAGPQTILNLMKQYQSEFAAPLHPQLLQTVTHWLQTTKLIGE